MATLHDLAARSWSINNAHLLSLALLGRDISVIARHSIEQALRGLLEHVEVVHRSGAGTVPPSL